MAFGIALRRQGWRIIYLGANTPIAPIASMARSVEADAVVLAATAASRFADVLGQLRDLASEVPVALAGAGAHPRLAAEAGAHLLEGDPVAGAREVARGLERGS